jgi:uncharacterized protein
MFIDVQRLSPDGETFVGEEPISVWALEGEHEVLAEHPIRYNLQAFAVSGELVVRGRLESDVRFRCSRCGEFFTRTVCEKDFSCAVDLESAAETVDLTAELRETMILLFPAYPVCDEQCRGLCPQCGKNRNQGTCGCRPPSDTRWDQLEKLQSH